MTAQLAELKKLSVAERLLLVEDLWDSIAEDGFMPEITPELAAELDRRSAELDANPANVFTLDEVIERARREFHG